MTRKQCYILLGISEGSSLEEVKRAYRKRAFELHPDLNPAPDASRKFQQLNEAYVLLLSFLEEDNNLNSHAERQAAFRQQNFSAADQTSRPGGRARSAYTGAARNIFKATDEADPQKKGDAKSEASDSGQFQKTKARATAAQASDRPDNSAQKGGNTAAGSGLFFHKADVESHLSREEVLSGVLRDPFARRVFEDIYSEIKQSGRKAGKLLQKSGRDIADLFPVRSSRGLIHSIKDWLRKQIDDEQTVAVPVHNLRPGMRIRLQIQQGMSGNVQNIEVTIPTDYTPGRPMRLKGLGRKIGPWLGDLYLRLIPKLV